MNRTKPISSKLKNQGICLTDSDNSRSFYFIMIQNRIKINFVCIACRHHKIKIKNLWTICNRSMRLLIGRVVVEKS